MSKAMTLQELSLELDLRLGTHGYDKRVMVQVTDDDGELHECPVTGLDITPGGPVVLRAVCSLAKPGAPTNI